MEPCHWYMTMAVQEQPCHGDMAVQWQPHHGREPNRIRLWQTRRMRARTNASMAVAMQEVPAPPHSQVQGICWGALARTFAGPKTPVLPKPMSGFLEPGNGMGDLRRVGSSQAWVAVYGLRNVGLRTLRIFVNLWKAAGAYGGRPVVWRIWKTWLSRYGLRTLRLFGKKCRHSGDMKVYKRRSIQLDYSWRG